MRLGDYLTVAFKDIRRQAVRSGLTIVALTISAVILITLTALSFGAKKAIVEELSPDNSLTTITVTSSRTSGLSGAFGNVQEANKNNTKLDDATAALLAKLPHATSVSPRAPIWELNTFTVQGSNKQFVAQAQGIVPNLGTVSVKTGQMFAPNDAGSNVILGYGYAKTLGFGNDPAALLGKIVTFTTQKGYRGVGAQITGPTATVAQVQAFNQTTTQLQAKIVGVTGAGSDQNGIFLPMEWARKIRTLNGYDNGVLKSTDQLASDGYGSIVVKADANANVHGLANAIDNLGYGEISTAAQIDRLSQFSTVMWVIFGSVSIIALLAACLGIVNTMLMTVSEQTYVIGIWRACGARKSTIAVMFLLEAGLLGLIGGTVGTAASVGICAFVNQHIQVLLATQNLSAVHVAVTPLWLLGASVGVTLVFGILSGLYPAWRAARQDPSKALSSL
jgi:putative ABC transport system permease protein